MLLTYMVVLKVLVILVLLFLAGKSVLRHHKDASTEYKSWMKKYRVTILLCLVIVLALYVFFSNPGPTTTFVPTSDLPVEGAMQRNEDMKVGPIKTEDKTPYELKRQLTPNADEERKRANAYIDEALKRAEQNSK